GSSSRWWCSSWPGRCGRDRAHPAAPPGAELGDRDLLLVLRKKVRAALDDFSDAFHGVPNVDESRVERSEPEAAQVRRPEVADDASVGHGAHDSEPIGVTQRPLRATP